MLAKTMLLPARKEELRAKIESIESRATRIERGSDYKHDLVNDLRAIAEEAREALTVLNEIERLES